MKKNKGLVRLMAVLALTVVVLPGCDLTSAQLTGLLQDLSAVGVNAVFEGLSARVNPDGNENLQTIIDIGQDAAQDCVDNKIDQQIPDDPKP